eukprot:Nk52_evm83s215 gene=Nk52_evmTU83s215
MEKESLSTRRGTFSSEAKKCHNRFVRFPTLPITSPQVVENETSRYLQSHPLTKSNAYHHGKMLEFDSLDHNLKNLEANNQSSLGNSPAPSVHLNKRKCPWSTELADFVAAEVPFEKEVVKRGKEKIVFGLELPPLHPPSSSMSEKELEQYHAKRHKKWYDEACSSVRKTLKNVSFELEDAEISIENIQILGKAHTVNHSGKSVDEYIRALRGNYDTHSRDYIISKLFFNPYEESSEGAISKESRSLIANGSDYIHTRIPFERAPWNKNFIQSKRYLESNFYVTKLAALLVRDITSEYLNHRIVDINTTLEWRMHPKDSPILTGKLVEWIKYGVQDSAEILKGTWYVSVAEVLNNETKAASSGLFACINTLAYIFLTGVLKQSLEDLPTQLLGNNKDENGVKLSFTLKLKDNQIVLYPPYEQVLEEMHGLVDSITHSLDSIQEFGSFTSVIDIEGSLSEMVSSLKPRFIRPYVCEKLLSRIKEQITTALNECLENIEEIKKTYSAFEHLISSKAAEEAESYIEEEHSFEEYASRSEDMKKMASAIRNNQENSHEGSIFCLSCESLNEDIADIALCLADKYLQKYIRNCQKENLEILDAFNEIQKTIQTRPSSVVDLIKLKAFLIKANDEIYPTMVEKVKQFQTKMMFVMEASTISKEDMEKNKEVLLWPGKLLPLFEDAENGCIEHTQEFRNSVFEKQQKNLRELEECKNMIADFKEAGDIDELSHYVKQMTQVQKKIQNLEEEIQRTNEEEEMLKWDKKSYEGFEDLLPDLQPYQTLYMQCTLFMKSSKRWLEGILENLDAEQIETEIDNIGREMQKLGKMFAKNPKPLVLVIGVKAKLEEFRKHLPLIAVYCNKGMRPRHWGKVSEIVGEEIMPDNLTSLGEMLSHDFGEYTAQLEDVSDGATKEYGMEKALLKMQEEWTDVQFTFVEYRDSGTYILSSVDDVQLLLDDHIVKTQTIKGSPFIKPIAEETNAWEAKLLSVQEILDEWLKVQSVWLYLEPIFSSEDIMKQMPEEGKRFKLVDKTWKEIVKQSIVDPKVLSISVIPQLIERLKESNEQLDLIQKGLNDYLEKKRLFFPRFFFLSNDELLEILSETKDPKRVQPHLKKCFEGISKLEFQGNLDITAMYSSEGEKVNLDKVISTSEAKGSVEKWLIQVQDIMKLSVQSTVNKALHDYSNCLRKEWVLNWPGQVVLCGTQKYWTSELEDAIPSSSVAQYAEMCTQQLSEIVELVRGELSTCDRIKLGALVVLDVHARDVTQSLADDNVTEINDFKWLSQLRYYWRDNDVVDVKMINSCKVYGYEYLGNSPRLVITPLTDRCYRTLMGALHLNLGGAPEGPAGTGKTETTKDLAKALAKQCVVFNCSDGLDFIAMGKFFKGVAAAGAWACFDEFNRIDLEVLSVVAQQILTIQRGIITGLQKINFEGTELPLDGSCAVFITMNPGYAGRSELPDNLKVLFRSVAMMVPNYALIAEISLYSCGFVDARKLAIKITATYQLCSEQLSSQSHYDYGMRAVKSVLTAAGNLKLAYPEEMEEILVLRSIVDVNLAKFLSQDVPLFNGIISDLFPGVSLPESDYALLNKAIEDNCKELNLQLTPNFVEKIQQIYEMMIVRHGFMIVGDPFGGKTCAYRVLAKALTDLHSRGELKENKVLFEVINPKSITMGQLYGQFDPASHEWSDGVLANRFREFASATGPERKWVLFDGPVDAIWIENMNTVLDDNKKLCLMSGEIIQLSNTMNLIFEVLDLAVASPATVSRCGMIYMEPHALGWEPLVDSWLNDVPSIIRNEEDQGYIKELFMWLVPKALKIVREDCRELLRTQNANLVNSLLNLYGSLMYDFDSPEISSQLHQNPSQKQTWLESLFLFSVTWSIGATIDRQGRETFQGFISAVTTPGTPDSFRNTFKNNIPDSGSCYDFVFIKSGFGKWEKWEQFSRIEKKLPENGELNSVMIKTVDTIRFEFVTETLMRNNYHVLAVGPTGTGKTSSIKNKLFDENFSNAFTNISLAFSARTSANQTQDVIMSKLDKRRKGVFGPPMGKKCVVFIDDLNMPTLEEYGAQPPIELLRQWLDHKHWYDRKDTTKQNLIDIQYLCAMCPPGGGRNDVTPRFIRHFNIVSINDFEDSTMTSIFSTIVQWNMELKNFLPEMYRIGTQMVQGTLSIYKASMENLLPTPNKSHYTFNLRDFARVVSGVMLINHESVENSSEKLMRLWVHEVLRVFYDRLVDDTDRKWLFDYIRSCFKSTFSKDIDFAFTSLLEKSGDSELKEDHLRKLMFGNYILPEADNKLYDEIEDMDNLKSVIEGYLDEYNSQSKKKMNLVMFQFAIEHVSRVCRILLQPGGNGLLVGVGGSGRQSVATLACFMCEYQLFQVEISKSYSKNDWREDIKKILLKAGADGRPSVFLFTDSQIKEETFLEDINGLLNSGDIPNLFATDEKSNIAEKVRGWAKEKNKLGDGTIGALFNAYIDRVKENLHIILAMSPVGDAFRSRLRQFPSLVNCCTINWFQPWPEDALEAIASKFLADIEMEDEIKSQTVAMCKVFHKDVRALSRDFMQKLGRQTYVTPTSYLELIMTYNVLLGKKREEVSKLRDRYVNGLEKLQYASDQVSVMQKDLEALQPELIKTTHEVEQMVTVIEKESAEAQAHAAIVGAEEEVASKKANEAQAMKEDCEADLAEALPALEAAMDALNTLKPSDITIVKSMKNPPSGVKLVMEAVCVMKEMKPEKKPDPSGSGKKIDDYWGPSVKLLADIKFLEKLKEYDKDNIPPAVTKVIRSKYMPNPEFDPEKVKAASSAAQGLCKWIIAMETYDRVNKVVAPKKATLYEAEQELEGLTESLNAKREELRQVEERLATLKAQYQESCDKKESLNLQVEDCSNKLERAEKLIGGLGGEKDRWTVNSKELAEAYSALTGDVLVASGIVAYLGPYSASFRKASIDEWVKMCQERQIPCSSNFNIVKIIGDPIQLRSWNIFGLPNDQTSSENGIIVSNSRRWPLMIDPQGQANKWIKNMYKAEGLEVLDLADKEYMRKLENCIQFGNPALLENVGEDLDPSLDPLLLKQVFKQGGINVIKLGENVIEYSKTFNFFITTTLRNPHYLPEQSTKVTLLNFGITQAGLQDQLLGITVAKERPDLEQEKNELIVQSAKNKKQLKEIEDQILEILSSASNILEDESAIQVLSSSKVLSDEISEKQKIAEVTEEKIDKARNGYKPIAYHSSLLFFCVSDMGNIDPMYQYSLGWFINLFINSIHDSNKSKILDKRLRYLSDHFTYNIYCNVCRSIFEKDKLLFSFLLCIAILKGQNEIDIQQWQFFLTGGVGIEKPPPNPDPSWMSDKSWGEIYRLSRLPKFKSLDESFVSDSSSWKVIYDALEPHHTSLPGEWEDKLDLFQRMIVVKCIRADKVVPFTQLYVEEKMGKKFIEPPAFDIRKSYNDSSAIIPLIFILSPGADPMASLLKFAEDKSMAKNMTSISLGQGQGVIAEKMIAEATKAGTWVVLQNCHLAVSWMPSLDKICQELTHENTNQDFRLWLTSYPSDKFPVSILQDGVKMTNEPPKGLKANLLGSYLTDPICDMEFFEGCSKPNVQEKLLFGLCFFHGLIQERRKFGPIGWNIPYEFNESDLRISARQLQMFLEEYNTVQFDALKYLTAECNYGGRVTDDWDRRTITTILSDFYNPSVVDDDKHKFSESGHYHALPKGASYSDYIQYIKDLPQSQFPEVFGMHSNVDITREINETRQLMDSIIETQEMATSESGQSPEALVGEIASAMLENLPDDFDIEKTSEKYPVRYEESMNTVLAQEMIRFNRLTSVVRTTLKNTLKATKGLVIMSAQLESVFNGIINARIPPVWAKASYPSLKPLGGYFDDLLKRLQFFQTWYDEGHPTVYWISGIFFTQSFLTGALQNYARKHKIAIDQLGFDFEVISEGNFDKPPAEGVYVQGLFLDGARWDKEKGFLADPHPKTIQEALPHLWLKPIKKSEAEIYSHYVCPVYKTSARRGILSTTGHSTNYVMAIKLKTDREQSFWIKRGVALLCQLDD